MNFVVRVGYCLAATAFAISCSDTPPAPTSPSANATNHAGMVAATADGATLKFNAPALLEPIDRVRTNDRRPTLVWANATAKYGEVGVAYDLELSTPADVVYSQTVGETPNFGAHIVPFEIEYDTVYSWRVRARVGNDMGPWSNWAEFLSPQRPSAAVISPSGGTVCAAPLSPLGPGENRKPRPNDSAIVRQVASNFPAALQGSCQEHGGSWEFMDRAIDALRAKDGRYGYNCKRGNCNDPSVDVASYYWGGGASIQGNNQVYIFDLIGGHCGANPVVVWNDVTDITYSSGTEGKTMYPRPGRNVTATSCTAAAGQ